MADEWVTIYFDGGSRGNPGPAAGAAYTDWQGGRERACYMPSATNNEAEYRGLLMAVALAQEHGLHHVKFRGDSKLVVMQISGEWQTKHPMMEALKKEALLALATISRWSIEWVGRAQNAEADRVANTEMDKHMGIVRPPIEISIEVAAEPREGEAELRPDIQKLNRLGSKAGFGDLKQLRVGGRDAFSRATLTSLEAVISNFQDCASAFSARLATDRLTEGLSDADRSKFLLQALRWSARGLQGDLALRKVLVDLEVAQNMRGKKR